MKRTFSLTRVPHHLELRRALSRMPRAGRERLAAAVMTDHQIDLAAALASDDPETLTAVQRRAIAQKMHDRGAAFMLSQLEEAV